MKSERASMPLQYLLFRVVMQPKILKKKNKKKKNGNKIGSVAKKKKNWKILLEGWQL